MGPEITTRIQAMLRALREVIIPAIDPQARMALEQAHLLMGYLVLIDHQYSELTSFRLQEIREFTGLLQGLIKLAPTHARSPIMTQAEDHLAPLHELSNLRCPADSVLRNSVERARDLCGRLVNDLLAREDPDLALSVARLVTLYAQKEILRERAWVLPAGLDPEPENVPGLSELVGPNSESAGNPKLRAP